MTRPLFQIKPARKQKHPIVLDGVLRWNTAQKMGFLFLFGGVGYGLIEVIWRGRTHPSMVLTGGVCFSLIYGMNKWLHRHSLIVRCAASATAITAVEFSVGIVVNRLLKLGVWDYSKQKFNLLGQICPLYTFFWFLHCIPLVFVLSRTSGATEKK